MLDTICDVMKMAYERNWISTRDGNASFRRSNDNFFYITPSGVRKQHLNAEMIIKYEFVNDELVRISDEYQDKIIGLKPSGELPMHLLLQKKVTENRVVLHLHPTYIVAAMYAGLDLMHIAQEFPEINRYTKVGPMVELLPPVSQELADSCVKALGLNESSGEVKYDIVGMKGHGVVVVAKDALTALEHVERLSHICEIVLASKNF